MYSSNHVLFVTIVIAINCIQLNHSTIHYTEKVWNNDMGNACNTRRIIPLTLTDFTGKSWHVTLPSSTPHMPMEAMGAGVNGDVYVFTSDDTSYPGK